MFTRQVKTYKPQVKVLSDRFRGVLCDNCFLELVYRYSNIKCNACLT